jgi:hypothetical protein
MTDRRALSRWWPPALLLVALPIAAGVTVVSAANLSPTPVALEESVAQESAADKPVSLIAAPALSSDVDPATYIQQIQVILPPPPPPATGGGSGGIALNYADAAAFCAGLNEQRALNGLATLGSCSATRARQAHANATAAAFEIWHQGDNIVGYSWSHASLIEGFMNSPGHRDQILTPSYTGAYVACAWSPDPPDGYADHIFCTADFYS